MSLAPSDGLRMPLLRPAAYSFVLVVVGSRIVGNNLLYYAGIYWGHLSSLKSKLEHPEDKFCSSVMGTGRDYDWMSEGRIEYRIQNEGTPGWCLKVRGTV